MSCDLRVSCIRKRLHKSLMNLVKEALYHFFCLNEITQKYPAGGFIGRVIAPIGSPVFRFNFFKLFCV